MANTAIDWEEHEAIQTSPGDDDVAEYLRASPTGPNHRDDQAGTPPRASRPGSRFPGMNQLEVLLEDPLIALWASEFGRRRYVTRMDALAALAVALDLPEPARDQIATRVTGLHSPVDGITC